MICINPEIWCCECEHRLYCYKYYENIKELKMIEAGMKEKCLLCEHFINKKCVFKFCHQDILIENNSSVLNYDLWN